jgi:hypothetical protein
MKRVNSYDDDEEDPELPDASDLDDDDDFSSEDSASSTMPVWILIGVILCLAVVVGLWLR